MKIRTDFVTNSSSVSTAEIVIDNPVLLEILQKYKEIGAFGEETSFGIGEFIFDSKVSGIKIPAIHFREELSGEGWATVFSSPKTLSGVLNELIAIIDAQTGFDQNLISHLKDELRRKDEEIEENYSIVYWTNLQEWEEPPEFRGGKFLYDQENGEKYYGYGSAEVIIENPILLEILQKYKDLGTFYPHPSFSIGNHESEAEFSHLAYGNIVMTPSLYVGSGEQNNPYRIVDPPLRLNDVANKIVESMELGKMIKERRLFKQLKAELKENHVKINTAYKYVTWRCQELLRDDSNPYQDIYDGYVDDSFEFKFDPNKGEETHYIRQAGPGWDEEVEEGFIYGEKHIVNGKVLVDFGCVLPERSDEAENDDDEEY